MMQVRALLDGQGWYDLRQYRLNPPAGADIHWSRLVDLPIAGLKLLLTPFVGGRIGRDSRGGGGAAAADAGRDDGDRGDRAAAGRPQVAFAIAIALLACAGSARGMWAPLRIDHHGWQLAMLALADCRA